MGPDRLSLILNHHFVLRHCTALQGFETPSDFRCGKGLRKWSRFFYLIKGKIDFVSHTGKALTIRDGDLLFLPYDIEYSSSWTDSRNGTYYLVQFILEDLDGNNLCLYDDITYLFRDTGAFRTLFSEMAKNVAEGTLGFQLRCQAQFMNLLYIIAMQVKQEDRRFRDIAPAIAQIEGNFTRQICPDDLARICNLSPATFRRRFLQYAAMPPVQYRNMLRLNKARELLLTGLYSVGEAAATVGIADLCYFSKLYKKQFGCPPSQDLPESRIASKRPPAQSS